MTDTPSPNIYWITVDICDGYIQEGLNIMNSKFELSLYRGDAMVRSTITRSLLPVR